MADESKKRNNIYDGRMMQGICTQWFIDKYGVNKEFSLYCLILRLTFGFKKRYGYIPSGKMPFKNLHTLKKYRDKLTEKSILEWKITKGYTMYKILEPKEEIKKFILKNDKENDKKKVEQTCSVEENLMEMWK